MSSRVFQSIVLQMKECTDRVIGVIDDQGTVVSCNQLTWIGEKWEGAASALNVNESAVVIYGDKTLSPWSAAAPTLTTPPSSRAATSRPSSSAPWSPWL